MMLVCILASVFFLQSFLASLLKSPIYDEPFHIAAALSYVETGRIVVNQQHPPLIKELSGLFLRAAGVRWPHGAPALEVLLSGPLAEEVGIRIIAENGPDQVLFWSRLPLLLLGTAFLFVLYPLARSLVGPGAALGAVFLYAFDPTLLGHTSVVATDVGIAFFVGAFLLTLWRYLQKPRPMRLGACGLMLGAMLGTKFSGVLMIPISGALLLAAALWPIGPDPWIPRLAAGPGALHLRRLVGYGIAFLGMGAIAFAILQYIYLFPANPLQYIDGMRLVNADHDPTYPFYLAGQLKPHFHSYFIVAYLLKQPVASIVAAGIGLIVVARDRNIPRLALAFALIPPAALLLGYTILSDGLGVRYIAPVLPFTHMLGGVGLVALFHGVARWQQGLGAFLCVWVVVAAAGIYPDQLSYFNEAACVLDQPGKLGLDGGSRCGSAWLDDSNLDWGQGAKQLKKWLDRNAGGRPVHVAYFGSFPPSYYGIEIGPTDFADALDESKPGLHVVSAQFLARARENPGSRAWLLRTEPVAVVGHTFYIYDVR